MALVNDGRTVKLLNEGETPGISALWLFLSSLTTIPLLWVFPRAHKQLGFRICTLTSATDIPPSEFGLSLGSIYVLSTWNVFKDSGLTIFMKLISKFIPF